MHASRPHRTAAARILLLDAAASGAMGLMLALLAAPLAAPFGLPAGLLRWAGVALVPFAGWLVYLATRAHPPIAATRAVIALNLLWVAASVLLVVVGPVAPTPLGTAFVLAQAAAVALFSALEHASLRMPRAALAA